MHFLHVHKWPDIACALGNNFFGKVIYAVKFADFCVCRHSYTSAAVESTKEIG